MSALKTQLAETAEAQDRRRLWQTLLPPILFSIFYFVDIFLRATEKYFWFDELVTLDICRIPLHALWGVLTHGADFNPPLFFILTKLSESILGPTLVGLRAPEIIGFWILCLSLYRIVNLRVGWLPATFAMIFPVTTGAFYYAYEARPHALVLGFCGLAFLFWQLTIERPQSRKWIAAFSCCLLGAFLLHCYAILIVLPFAIYELLAVIQYRRIRWAMWIAMLIPSVAAALVYIPLLASYRKYMTGTDYQSLFLPNVGALAGFYVYVLAPCIFVVVAACVAFGIECIRGCNVGRPQEKLGLYGVAPEIIVSAIFLILPIFGLILGIVVRGPFFGRYFLSVVIGFGVLIGLAAGERGSRSWVAVLLTVVLCCPLLWGAAALISHRLHGKAEDLREPSSGYDMNSSLRGPLDRFQLLMSHLSDPGPIAVLDSLDFYYLLHYAPNIRSRLYYIKDQPNDFAYIGFKNYHFWAPFEFNRELTRPELLKLAPRFLVYGRVDFLRDVVSLLQEGATIKSMQLDNGRFLMDLQDDRPNKP